MPRHRLPTSKGDKVVLLENSKRAKAFNVHAVTSCLYRLAATVELNTFCKRNFRPGLWSNSRATWKDASKQYNKPASWSVLSCFKYPGKETTKEINQQPKNGQLKDKNKFKRIPGSWFCETDLVPEKDISCLVSKLETPLKSSVVPSKSSVPISWSNNWWLSNDITISRNGNLRHFVTLHKWHP